MGGALAPQCGKSPLGLDDGEASLGAHYSTHLCPQTIGQGQFSKAFICWRREASDCSYALKVFSPGSEAAEHFANEVRVLRALGSHPRIIELVDVDADDLSAMRVVLELCEGGQLYDRLVVKGRYEEPEAAKVMRQIFEAVEFMHARGVMHRDMKPENVLLISKESDVDVKVCDFGIAKMADAGLRPRRPKSRTFTGSDFYLAPEMIRQEEYSTEVDIWAIGVTGYALLSGSLPFVGEGGDLRETYHRIVARDLDFGGEAWEDVPETAIAFIDKALSIRPQDRPTAAAALHHAWLNRVWIEDCCVSDTSDGEAEEEDDCEDEGEAGELGGENKSFLFCGNVSGKEKHTM